ncbi:glutathione gamma-glutamylcysteinyltransferase 2-like [Gastrolobium bilobum]|uniref:glutathione gamma-glutamylcysteinyltransferase 2-like n=1 Tax=Gastrolobium bilobum TaxID=150636 RepID=UPI002AB2A5BC|nr:glutathione gamma-glutamylcysteinyltransferase 2-like [Gastrolobium bilobum]
MNWIFVQKIFAEALGQGTIEGFFKLISYYQTQSEPAYCGIATLTVVLNALAIDPGRKWKGPWRWFDDSMLDCCEPLAKIKSQGITFGKVACLTRCNGAKVEAFRSDECTVHDFCNRVISSCSSEDFHVIVSYHRKAFNQVFVVVMVGRRRSNNTDGKRQTKQRQDQLSSLRPQEPKPESIDLPFGYRFEDDPSVHAPFICDHVNRPICQPKSPSRY